MIRLGKRGWLGVFGILLLLGAYSAAQSVVSQLVLLGRERPYWPSIGYNFLLATLWLVVIPPLWAIADRVRPRRWGWLRWIALQVPITAGFALLHVLLFSLFVWVPRWVLGSAGSLLAWMLHLEPTVYMSSWLNAWAALGAFYGVDAYRRWREEQLRAERLSAQLQEAKLQALKMQLHPHFLFNTLQTISALIPRDPQRAEALIEKLGELLRTALELGDRPLIPLDDELAFVERYLDLQQARLGERLRVRWEVEPSARERPVPAFVLQPLVENAIKHGIAPRPEPGCLAVGARLREDQLVLWVRDDGPGLNGRLQEGHGLRNLRERLRTLYGSEAKLELLDGTKGGLMARIEIPLEEQRGS